MFAHIFKNKYLYATPDALRQGIPLVKIITLPQTCPKTENWIIPSQKSIYQ